MSKKIIVAGFVFGLCLGGWAPRAGAQQLGAPTVLVLDERNGVNYNEDTADVTKFATSSAIVPVSSMPSWTNGTGFLDIYAINGQAVKGLHSYRFTKFGLSTTALTPGVAISDVARLSLIQHVWEIQDANGVAIGTIMGQGFANGPAPPGSPAAQQSSNISIVGGTGAYVGVRGTIGGTALPIGLPAVAQRQASVIEDPAYRRVNGGGLARWVMTIYPGDAPQVISVAHADTSAVSNARPAVAGELLTLVASGLGPTRPNTEPGQAFPTTPQAQVNAPVNVLVNGRSATITQAIGYPGSFNQYLLYFNVPSGVAGLASVQLTTGFLAGPGVYIPVQ
jgi:uncharacterized protein (TIGR03437 family)